MSWVALIAVLAALGAGLSLSSALHVVYSRRRARAEVAAQVLRCAAALDGHRLWVRVPFPAWDMRPWRAPWVPSDGPRRWQRVVGTSVGHTLVMDDGALLAAVGCDQYLYARQDGRAISFYGIGDSLPEGVDPDSVSPRDLELGT